MNPRWHPLWRAAQLPWPAVAALLIGLMAVSAGLGIAASGRGPMRHSHQTMVALELHPSWAPGILFEWGSVKDGFSIAREAVAWDFPFIAGYVSLLSIACLAFARRGGWFERWGNRFAWLALLAGGLDVAENYGIWRMLDLAAGPPGPLGQWPAFTAAFAWPKWIIVLSAGTFLVAASWRAFRWETGARAEP